MDTQERVRQLVKPLVEETGAHLYDVTFESGTLKVAIQHPQGVDLQVISKLSRKISHLLDEEDPINGSYTLEVSSPGLERNLRRPEHFEGAIGEKVTVKTYPGTVGDRRVVGTLKAADDQYFTVENNGEHRRLAYGDVSRARTVFEWGPENSKAPKSKSLKGSQSSKKSSSQAASGESGSETQISNN